MVGSPKAMLSTTFAVLRPTPGSSSSASRERGTWPPCSAISFCDSATTFLALVRNSPMVLTSSRTRSSPSAAIFAGVSASANSAGVALLTPASVACADSTTATSSVNGLMCRSSPFGSGLAAWKRRNTSSICTALSGATAPSAAFTSAPACLPRGLTLAALPLRALVGAFLTEGLRTCDLRAVFFAMFPV